MKYLSHDYMGRENISFTSVHSLISCMFKIMGDNRYDNRYYVHVETNTNCLWQTAYVLLYITTILFSSTMEYWYNTEYVTMVTSSAVFLIEYWWITLTFNRCKLNLQLLGYELLYIPTWGPLSSKEGVDYSQLSPQTSFSPLS